MSHIIMNHSAVSHSITSHTVMSPTVMSHGVGDAAHAIQIDPVVAGICLLAWLSLLLLWRRQRHQRQRGALTRLEARLACERGSRELTERTLADTRRQVGDLSKRQQSLRDAERRRIARDLHDDLGQHLLAMSLELGSLAEQHPALREALEKVDQRIAMTLRSMRSIVRDLQPEALDAGLRGAVEQQVAQFSRLSGIQCQLHADAGDLDGGIDKVIYRIVQESLSNIARHAKASQVSIGIVRAADGVRLTVRDNGVGIGAAPGRPKGPLRSRRGNGLRGMAERVSEAGGRFDVASAPGRGTALTMSFPLPS
jgi:signal transduction histidine kinase